MWINCNQKLPDLGVPVLCSFQIYPEKDENERIGVFLGDFYTEMAIDGTLEQIPVFQFMNDHAMTGVLFWKSLTPDWTQLIADNMTSVQKAMLNTVDEVLDDEIVGNLSKKVEESVKESANMKPSETQIGGSHYKTFKIQPYEFCLKNGLNNLQSEAISYIVRANRKWKGNKEKQLEDLTKAIHTIELWKEAIENDEVIY